MENLYLTSSSSSSFRSIGDSRGQARKLLSLRRAIVVALVCTLSELRNDNLLGASEFVRLQKQVTQLREQQLKTELDICDLMLRMSHEDKLQTVFECFDKDASGAIDTNELSKGLKALRVLPALIDAPEMVEDILIYFSESQSTYNGLLDVAELGRLLESLSDELDCDIDDLFTLVLTQICFSQDGQSFLRESVQSMTQGADQNNVSFEEAISEVRLILLFDLLDCDDSGKIMFSSVLEHLVKTTNVFDTLKYNPQRTMDYSEFSDLLLNLSRAYHDCDLHRVCNQVTLSKCHNKGHLQDIFLKVHAFGEAKRVNSTIPPPCSILEDRIGRLFTLWDRDSDGTLDAREFALGLRLFQDSKQIDETISESMNALFAFDTDGDNRLDRIEFSCMLQKLAIANGVELCELVDFMVVISALNDVNDQERVYITSLLTCQVLPNVKPSSEQIQGKVHRHGIAGFFRQNSLKKLMKSSVST